MTTIDRAAMMAQAAERTYDEFAVRGLSGNLRIRSLTEQDRIDIAKRSAQDLGSENAWCCIFAIVDDEGDLMLHPGDIDAVKRWNSVVTQTVIQRLDALCGVDDRLEDERIIKAAKELLGCIDDCEYVTDSDARNHPMRVAGKKLLAAIGSDSHYGWLTS